MSDEIPQLLKGFRDFGPQQMSARLAMFAVIRAAFERFGFEPMETPALEYAETLLGKYGAEEKLMYRFRDQGDREVALRYDLTVPLARFYAQNRNDVPKPFKRYAIGPVWRADKPQQGRFREFYQCDVDCVGSDSAVADAEAIAAVASALNDVGIKNVKIRLNNRKFLDGVFAVYGIQEQKYVSAMRFLDRLDKLTEKEVLGWFTEFLTTGARAKELFKCLRVTATNSKGVRDARNDFDNQECLQGIEELYRVFDALEALGVKHLVWDRTLARGLDYYTGTVCEILLPKLPGLGSVAGGGRYDQLIGEFGGGQEQIPAVGMSIGIDRLLTAMEGLYVRQSDPGIWVLVFNLDVELQKVYLQLVGALRQAGVNTDFYYEPASLAKQFKYAEKKGTNLALIVGTDEVKRGKVTLRDLATRKQWQVPAEKSVEAVVRLLERSAS